MKLTCLTRNSFRILLCPGLGAPKSDIQPTLDWTILKKKKNHDIKFELINYKNPEEGLSWNINLWTKDIISTLNRGSDENIRTIVVCNSASAQAFLRALVFIGESSPNLLNCISGAILSSPGVGMRLENYVNRVLPNAIEELFRGEKVDHPSIDESFNTKVDLRCLWEYARTCVLNTKAPFPKVEFPIRIIHGLHDKLVPCEKAFELLKRIPSPNKELYLIKSGHIVTDSSKKRIVMHALDDIWEFVQQNMEQKDNEENIFEGKLLSQMK